LIVKGEDEVLTAMAKTVGLPMAIAAKLILQGKIIDKGVQIPLSPMYYEPILKELKKFDINFIEH
jgi:saccharopine dehydrogenase-like NADP-dependent oxidoreductase